MSLLNGGTASNPRSRSSHNNVGVAYEQDYSLDDFEILKTVGEYHTVA